MNPRVSTDAPGGALAMALRDALGARSGGPVTLIETHISWVLLADELAYKLKKPVHFSFVDFRALTDRKHCCEEEVRLNRRLAPALYLGVDPVCGTAAAPRIGGPGEPIDYLVRMRRFPDGALLQERLRAGAVEPASLDGLAQRLARFHREAPVADPLCGHGTPQRIESAVGEVVAQLRRHLEPAAVQAIDAWFAQQTHALRPVWRARLAGGAVRECHGDLHAANVVWFDGQWQAFDGIEFDPALRWIDTMSDLVFLTMDLRAHRRDDLAWRLLDRYLTHGGDHQGLAVLRFYEAYRALVRALVEKLRPHDAAADAGQPDHLACALRCMQPEGPPSLAIMHGLSGSGKSTLAAQLLERAGAIRLRSDVERKRLFGLEALARSRDAAVDIYTPDATRRTFEQLAQRAREALRCGCRVIVDAAFLRRAEREHFRALADALRVPFAIIDCHADEDELRRRVTARASAGTDASEADSAVLERQRATHEPLDAAECESALSVRTDQPLDLDALCARWLAMPCGGAGARAG